MTVVNRLKKNSVCRLRLKPKARYSALMLFHSGGQQPNKFIETKFKNFFIRKRFFNYNRTDLGHQLAAVLLFWGTNCSMVDVTSSENALWDS